MTTKVYQSRVRLFDNVPFDLNYEHTRWFSSKAEQNTYFNSLNGITLFDDVIFKYIRIEEGEVKVKATQEQLIGANYIEIKNENKIYYGFITEVLYGNSNMAIIKFTLDVIQTFMFDISFKKSFIEREHCNRWNKDGSPIVNTVPENFDLGNEYQLVSALSGGDNYWQQHRKLLLITSTEPLGNDNEGLALSGIATPMFYYIFMYTDETHEHIMLNGETLNNVPHGQSIFNLFKILFQEQENQKKIVDISYLPFLPLQNTITKESSNTINITCSSLSKLDIGLGVHLAKVKLNFARKINKFIHTDNIFGIINIDKKITESKLLFYPYSFLSLKDNLGKPFLIKPELNGDKLEISASSLITPNPRVLYGVETYKGIGTDFDKGLIRDFITSIPLISDYSETYLQGNKNSLAMKSSLGIVGGISSIGLGAMAMTTGVGGLYGIGMLSGGIMSTMSSIGNVISKVEDINNIPDSVEQQSGYANLNVGFNKFAPVVDVMRIRDEKLFIIQDFFKMYGYAVHRLKVPNIKTRQNFNYVKTQGANIIGKVPKEILDKLIEIFNKGITLWHTDNLFDYDVENNERS